MRDILIEIQNILCATILFLPTTQEERHDSIRQMREMGIYPIEIIEQDVVNGVPTFQRSWEFSREPTSDCIDPIIECDYNPFT